MSSHKIPRFTQSWDDLSLGIVFIQEHWSTPSTSDPLVTAFSRRAGDRGWTVFWSYDDSIRTRSTRGRGKGGVAIAIRTCLLRDGIITVIGDPQPVGPDDGRALSLNITWAGHKLTLASIYLPCLATESAHFMRTRLVPLVEAVAAARSQLLLGGDLNFAPNPSLDRIVNSGGLATRPSATTEAAATAWASLPALAGLVDVFREQHPFSRHMTWRRPGGRSASRIDRFYTSRDLATFISCPSNLSLAAIRHSVHDSDHSVIVCHLAPLRSGLSPATSTSRRLAAPRLNVSFMRDPDLCRQFETYLLSILSSMPSDDESVKKWWLRFKSKYLPQKIRFLNRDFFSQNAQQDHLKELKGTLAELLTQMNGYDLDAVNTACAEIPHIRSEIGRIEQELEQFQQIKTRRDWIHSKERPSVGLTKLLTSKPTITIPALYDSSGTLQTSATRCADVVIDYWADICAAPHTSASAQATVLAAVDSHGVPVLDPDAVHHLGSPTVTEAEIITTLRKSSPHTAPGPDGIPMKLYKTFRRAFAPILARVFTAIGTTGSAPRNFLRSIITSIPKKGNSLHVANTRPISLLGTDYRILTRGLCARLSPILSTLIDPAQTAYLHGRNIGDNIMLMQLLPAWLQQHSRSALMVFCDFRKAYDTIDRDFLFVVARKFGLGEGFISWIKLLLTDTRSAAIIDGCLSSYRLFHAGLRQGDPLSAPLYLLIGQVAMIWLKENGFGIVIDHGVLQITAGQHAAMESGRRNWFDRVLKHTRALTAPSRGRGRGRGRSSRTSGSIHRPAMTPGPEMLASVSHTVHTEFWASLNEIASFQTLPPAWLQAVPTDHPFLHPDSTRSSWVVTLPE